LNPYNTDYNDQLEMVQVGPPDPSPTDSEADLVLATCYNSWTGVLFRRSICHYVYNSSRYY